MSQSGDYPLCTENFGRRYHRRRPWAVRGVSILVPPGSITALVGPNGAGKSTLIRACLGFEHPDEGRVLVAGADPEVRRTQAVNAIGYVPQAASLYPALTIEDHLAIGRAARAAFDSAYARSRLERLGLSARRRVSELSGGEQAHVALALALGTRAPLLLLDEPLASLDPLARRDFLRLLLEHVREHGATAVMSSHIVTDVEQACDRLLILAGGRLVLHDDVRAAIARFRIVDGAGESASTVGVFTARDGTELSLVADNAAGRPATLEEIVLGHLAAGRKLDQAA